MMPAWQKKNTCGFEAAGSPAAGDRRHTFWKTKNVLKKYVLFFSCYSFIHTEPYLADMALKAFISCDFLREAVFL